MDPITAAILAVLPAVAADMVKSGVKDAYEGLKAVIRRKWGETAPISKAISALEEDPNSKAQAAVLEEKVSAVKANDDAEVAQALHQLIEQMKKRGLGGEAVGQDPVQDERRCRAGSRRSRERSYRLDDFRYAAETGQ